MQTGYKYISFEDCLERIPKTEKIWSSDYNQTGIYPIVSQEELFISGYWNNSKHVLQLEHPVVVFGDHTRVLKYIDFDFVIGADGVKVLSPKPFLLPKFFYYYLKWVNIPSLGYSRHYKLLKQITIAVPPKYEQEQIVSELDLLSGIIDKQKAQLKELDNLAQSIFYDMFGDPVENEKGFGHKKIEEVCSVTSSTRIFAYEYSESGIPFYRGKEVSELSRGESISSELYISLERYSQLLDDHNVPCLNDILITAVGTIGNIWVVNTSKPFYFKDGNIIWLRNINFSELNSCYFRFSLYKMIAYEKENMSIGSAYQALTIQNLKKMNILIPSLLLQEKFAEKIENIEKQKETIIRSIAETQQLFDSRMAYWFD